MEVIELDELSRKERFNEIEERSMNLPETSRKREELNNNAKFEELTSNVRNITREMDKPVHRKLTIHGYISNNYKRTSLKGSKNIASINTLENEIINDETRPLSER